MNIEIEWAQSIEVDSIEELPNPPPEPHKWRIGIVRNAYGVEGYICDKVWKGDEWVEFLAESIETKVNRLENTISELQTRIKNLEQK